MQGAGKYGGLYVFWLWHVVDGDRGRRGEYLVPDVR